jgi:predicted DsbA family dithiol-disulfide isomerase
MKIDFVSDVSCPWCVIGLLALEQALVEVAAEGIQPTVQFQPFELNPQMGPEGQEIVEHLMQKYGIDAAQVAANTEAIRRRGAELGFTFGAGQTRRIYNTFDTHRLLHWAGLQSAEAQRALKYRLFEAYFTQGLNPSDTALLQRMAAEVGLDGAEAAAVLASDRYATEVRQAESRVQRNGIHSVPAVIIDDQYLVSGGQPAEVFAQALRQVAARQG